ncbi:unnamed protein product [Spirodela intermedia]|uniref:TNase-like domain-containing protein n=1 Tax=Spirodela intermedia TaxID=51605 RepID=A0A7I8K5N3_SPIIN|nr:unnamed protein product [Spirodela intermedia]
MGNALRFLYRCCRPEKPSAAQPPARPDRPLGPHGVSQATVGVSALARDLFNFEIGSQVPDGLSLHVVSSKKAQSNWYNKLSAAWKEARPPPRTPEEAARLVVQTLKGHKKADVEGFLRFYGLPLLQAPAETTPPTPHRLPEGVKFEVHTLPVDYKDVGDGDTINVYVDAAGPRESAAVPAEVRRAAVERANARAVRDFTRADALQKMIQKEGYRVIDGQSNRVTLAKKYRIRLRGIDAPETAMPFGKEAKEVLAKLVQGKPLRVLVYGEDCYQRQVGDIYCQGVFVQEVMLKTGCAWHYVAYDKRPEFAMWESQARSARIGLWASRNPQKPWEWRRDKRNGL